LRLRSTLTYLLTYLLTVPFLSYLTLNNIVTLKSWSLVTQGHSNGYHSKAWCGFMFAFHSKYGSILHHFRDKPKCWSKTVIFSYLLHSTPPLRGSPSEYCNPVWYGKFRMVWLPDGGKTLMIYLTVSTEYRRVTDRRTGKRTDRHLATA